MLQSHRVTLLGQSLLIALEFPTLIRRKIFANIGFKLYWTQNGVRVNDLNIQHYSVLESNSYI